MVGHMPASVPRLAGHRLQGDDGVDGTALRYLLKHAIEMGKVLEEEERRKDRLLSFCGAFFVEPLVGDIMADVAHAASAAKRRRERRLRAMLRHERRSVAMALAEFTHHSSRGQRTARAWEEVENVSHDGLRHRRLHLRGADAAADVVDHSSLAFLLKASLRQSRGGRVHRDTAP